MARSRGRPSLASTTKSTPAKRAQPPTTPVRQSKRIKTTPKKSEYFEHASSASSSSEEESADEDASEASGYEDEDASVTEADTPTSEEEDEEEEYASSEDELSRKRRKKGNVGIGSSGKKSTAAGRGKSTPITSSATKAAGSGTELWREGVRSHLAPGEEIYIALPKARSAGKIAYADTRIHPNTLLFLGDLAAHNERAWLKTHDADFRQAERDFRSWAEGLGARLSDDVDASIPELPFKDVVMRIYRDVRFSRDPTPYKPHFSVAWSRTGRKGPYAAYYLQVGKGKSFFGGGLWQPPADQLAKIRRAIDGRATKLKNVLMREGLRKSFLGGVAAKDQRKVVKAFCNTNKEGALKTRPKDYQADHPEIELLKLKSFTLGYKLKDEEITAPDSMDRIVGLMKDMEPWVTYLNSVVMPDGDGSSSSSDDDDEDGEEDGGEDGDEEDEDEAQPEPEGGFADVDSEDPGPDSDEPEDWEPE